MKRTLKNVLLVFLSVLMVLSCISCGPNAGEKEPDDPQKQETQQTKEITLAASSLKLPEGSAFSLSFAEENEFLQGVKSALPVCGNAFLNDLIATTVKTRLLAFLPTSGTCAAVDVEECRRANDRYTFSFVLYYNLPDSARSTERFRLSCDVAAGKLLTLGDLVQPSHFEKGYVQKYLVQYLSEKYALNMDEASMPLVAAESTDNFYVDQAGACIVFDKGIRGSTEALTCYISDGAITIFKRKGTVSETEPENAAPVDYEPAQEGEKVVAMTFDDGPGNSATTKRLLDYLESNGIKATFFVNGYNYSNLEKDENAKAYVRRAVEIGCEVGNHSYDHPLFHKLTPEQRTYQLERNAELIEAACGVYPTLFRAPGGIFPEGMKESEDYFYIFWSADGEDWRRKNDSDGGVSLAQDYLKLIGPGSIVLMHDIYKNSVDAAIIIMNTLKAQGYRFVTISELLDLQAKTPDGTIYTSQNGTRKYMSNEKNG